MRKFIINKQANQVTILSDRRFIRTHKPTPASMQRIWQQFLKTSTDRKPDFTARAHNDSYIISNELNF